MRLLHSACWTVSLEVLEPDLLVTGSIARWGASGFQTGNTAEAILNEVACSVAIVKSAGGESPIEL